MWSLSASQVFTYSNLLILPAWALLIFAPRWRWTRVIAAYVTPALLSLLWLSIVLVRFAPVGGGFGSLEQVTDMLVDPWFVLAGWEHAIIFDLFVGAWATRDAQRLGIGHAYVIPCLILMFLAGPIGLLAYFVVRVVIVRRWPWR